jgi:hypothetical protein
MTHERITAHTQDNVEGVRWNEFLSTLVGRRLSAVDFVRDYVMFRFHDSPEVGRPNLQYYVMPTVVIGGHAYKPSESGWTRALLSLVGEEVLDTREGFELGVTLVLESGMVILRPPESELIGPEIALLADSRDGMGVWRPGERAFEYLR